jgi:hypothetical protein
MRLLNPTRGSQGGNTGRRKRIKPNLSYAPDIFVAPNINLAFQEISYKNAVFLTPDFNQMRLFIKNNHNLGSFTSSLGSYYGNTRFLMS